MSLPLYMRVVQHYRGLILKGQLSDGDRFPSVRALSAQWRIAHATAAKVVATMQAEGLLRTRAGGTIVDSARVKAGSGEVVPHSLDAVLDLVAAVAESVMDSARPSDPHIECPMCTLRVTDPADHEPDCGYRIARTQLSPADLAAVRRLARVLRHGDPEG